MLTTPRTPAAVGRTSGGVLRQVVALLLVGTAALLGVALTAVPAQACSCVAQPFGKQLDAADTVVVATLEDETVAADGTSELQVVATRIYKGEVADARMTVTAAGGTCAFWSGSSEQRLLLVLSEGNANVCSGSRVASSEVLEKVQARLGVGQRLAPPAAPGAELVTLETHAPRDFARLAAPGAAAALLGLLGLGVVSRVQKL